jgi:hypothetical protein
MLVEDAESNILQVSNASLLGALIVHVYASIISFLGAFLLIRYKLKEATREEMIVEGITMVNSPREGSTSNDVESMVHKSVNYSTAMPILERNKRNSLYPAEPPIFSADPHIEQVGQFRSNESSQRLLSRTHALCVFLAAVGFILAIVGMLCHAWALQQRAVSIFVSTCLGGAVLTTFTLFI